MPSDPASDDPVDSAGATLSIASSGVRSGTPDTLFKAGDRVAENIELVSLLGVGGMGDVWLANHIGLDTTVAVKFMAASLASNGALIERFGREAKLASRIKSPHVVQIFDFAATHEGIPYMVMELIAGETMGARLQRDSKLDLEETGHILVQLCRGLGKAHEMGIIHRDMKPDNVLLGEEEGELFVRILDFGIAKHVDAPKGATDAGAQLGTPSYMSPEQLFHPTDVDHRSDLWSLGVMTYLCLTGSLPFNAESFGAICVAINEGTYPLASKLNPGIPRAMDAWFSKALAVPCEERFSSAKEMSDAYLLVLEGIGQLPLWAVRKDSVEGEPPSFAGGTGGVTARASLIPARPVPGSRRRAAAVVVGGAMLVAAGFWSRDASLDQFVKAHVRTGWAPLVDSPPAELAVDTTSVAPPSAMATELPSSAAIVPVALVPVASATVAKPAPRQSTPRVAPVAPSVLTTTTMPGVPAVRPTAESETNPYSESVPPSAPSPRLSGSPHAPAL